MVRTIIVAAAVLAVELTALTCRTWRTTSDHTSLDRAALSDYLTEEGGRWHLRQRAVVPLSSSISSLEGATRTTSAWRLFVQAYIPSFGIRKQSDAGKRGIAHLYRVIKRFHSCCATMLIRLSRTYFRVVDRAIRRPTVARCRCNCESAHEARSATSCPVERVEKPVTQCARGTAARKVRFTVHGSTG